MSLVLQNIAQAVRKKVELRKQALPLSKLQEKFPSKRIPLGFFKYFKADSINIIAEIKYQSPSEGNLKQTLGPVPLAAEYINSGARALSILTEEDHFGGKIGNLVAVRREFQKTPLLMKDFFIDEYQIYEAALAGADAILLIVALLDKATLVKFMNLAETLGLECLVEVHSEEELTVAKSIRAQLVGINNRNLKTLEVTMDIARSLAPLAPDFATLICESGISNGEQIKELRALGFSGFLVGSSLMKNASPGEALAALLKGAP